MPARPALSDRPTRQPDTHRGRTLAVGRSSIEGSPRPAYARVVASGTSSIIPELRIIRTRAEGEQRATFFELFFDLVYVFAVTQLSHHLLDDLRWPGAAETAFMLVAVYWA